MCEWQAVQLSRINPEGNLASLGCCWAGLNTVAHAKPELALALPFPSTTQLLILLDVRCTLLLRSCKGD